MKIAAPASDGVSLLPLLHGDPAGRLRLYAETGYTHAEPDAFDPNHYSAGARSADAYEIGPGGSIQMTAEAHRRAMLEKDVGAFDGEGWLIRSRRADGTVGERCRGRCSPDLSRWLSATARPAD